MLAAFESVTPDDIIALSARPALRVGSQNGLAGGSPDQMTCIVVVVPLLAAQRMFDADGVFWLHKVAFSSFIHWRHVFSPCYDNFWHAAVMPFSHGTRLRFLELIVGRATLFFVESTDAEWSTRVRWDLDLERASSFHMTTKGEVDLNGSTAKKRVKRSWHEWARNEKGIVGIGHADRGGEALSNEVDPDRPWNDRVAPHSRRDQRTATSTQPATTDRLLYLRLGGGRHLISRGTMRESNFAFPPQNRACVCITSQLYDRRALDATSALPLYNSLTHLVYLTSTSPRIREILTLDGGLERLVRILRDFCANPPRRRDAAWIYALSPPDAEPAKRIDHRISPPTFDLGDDDNGFFLESSSRAELEKAAQRFKIPRQPDIQKPHPTAHSLPYIPTPGTAFPYQIDPLAARTFSLAFQCVVNIGVRGSEHIRRRVVQAGALGVVSCILAVWLKGKGFAIGPSATGSGAPRESREVRVRRREEALERQRAHDLARALEHATSSENLRPRSVAQPQPRAASVTIAPLPIAPPVRAGPSSDEGDEEMSASDMGPSPTPPPASAPMRVGSVGRSLSNDSDGSYSVPSAASIPGPSAPSGAGAFTLANGSHARSLSINRMPGSYDLAAVPRTASPIPIPSMSGSGAPPSPVHPRAISPNTTQSSDASASATPIGSGTPTGSVVVPGRDRSGTVVGRPVWDDPPQQTWVAQGGPRQGAPPWNAQQPTRPVWSDAHDDTDDMGTREMTGTGRRGTITRRPPRRERDTDGDDTEADADDNNGAQQGERRTIGIVDAADGDGAMAMDMMGEGVGVGVVALEQNDDLAMGAPPGAPGAVPVGVGVGITTTPRPRVAAGNDMTPRAGLAPLGLPETAAPEPRRAGASIPLNPGPYGDDEVLFSLQLLAYLSKYPHVRQAFYETPATLRALVDASNEPKPTAPPLSATAQSPNVFSLVERFTFRPSPSETTLPRLPHEIQYWAGVIMRNACRKDDQRGGIRQCANMLCGRWEEFPREFAKCRRCRKAKYCGKECQSKAWAEGHRFWCSAREEEDGATVVSRSGNSATSGGGAGGAPGAAAAVATEVEVPTRRGLTGTVTRALVNIAGGMAGRGANAQGGLANATATTAPPRFGAEGGQPPVFAPGPANAPGFGGALIGGLLGAPGQARGLAEQGRGGPVPELVIHANMRPQQGPTQPARTTGITTGAATQAQVQAARNAGLRGMRPLAFSTNVRGFGAPGVMPTTTGASVAANWGPRGMQVFNTEVAQAQDAGPSRRTRGPETARRRSGTMPSQGGPLIEEGTGRFDATAGRHDGASRAGDPWSMVPVQRVPPAQVVPSAPHTTPQHVTQPLDETDDDMVLG
ncbi:MYND finger protein [Ceratobasidium theobromae]|uniref:MYND finger protein n=1 Tax=Ceratobasidium theobromae TaxID=1582974 RepID=A0A5N5QE42_9AGAM|nr:MYND finger protein [Ceratobasidium theobromae]